MYFVLDRFWAKHPARWISKRPFLDVDFDEGMHFDGPIPNPLEIELDPYNRKLSDQGPNMPAYFKGRIPVLRDDLLNAMRQAGADNLDAYPVRLIDPDSGTTYDNYKAVNIIGLIAAADMGASTATVHPGGPVIDVDFDHLVVDETKTGGALIFRLAESTNVILVHERLRDRLLAAGFAELEFLPPESVAT
jgi:Immunity protein family (Imm11)